MSSGFPPAFIYIGASLPHVLSIRAIREAGIYTVATDLQADAPGLAAANRFEIISATDVPSLLALAIDISSEYEIIGCYGVADYASLAIAAIYRRLAVESNKGSQRLALIQRYLVPALKKSANKSEAKYWWRAAGLPTPVEVWSSRGPNPEKDAEAVFQLLSGPVMVKPMDAYNSRGVARLSKPDLLNLTRALAEAGKFGTGVSVENYCGGQLVNVDGLMIDGEMYPVSITDRSTYSSYNLQPSTGVRPTSLPSDVVDDLFDLAREAAVAIGFLNGPFTIDLILGPHGPTMLELTPNFHAVLSEIIAGNEWALRAWLAYLCGDQNWRSLISKRSQMAVGYVQLYSSCPGVLTAIHGREKLEQGSNWVEYYGLKDIGDPVRGISDGFGDVCGVVWLQAADRGSLDLVIEQAKQTLIFDVA